jgi:hypothetical protein
MRLAAAAALTVLLSSGCAWSEPESNAPLPTTGEAQPATRLVIDVWPSGTGTPVRTTLECDPTGGTHPQALAACRAVRANPTAFAPVRPDLSCAAEFGGPARARVRGVLAGAEVSAELNRTDACQIARWDALAPLFDVEPS